MSCQPYFKLVLHSLKPRTRQEYNKNLCQFPAFCEEDKITFKRPEQFDRITLRYTHYVLDYRSGDGRGHISMAPYAFEFCPHETKYKLHLLHSALFGGALLKPSERRTPCPHVRTLCISYTLQRIGRFDMSLAVLLAIDCHLRVE